MAKAIRVPDPVANRIDREAERQDVARGVIVKEWMEKAERFDEVQHR
jgi:predicted transcriptional regulator